MYLAMGCASVSVYRRGGFEAHPVAWACYGGQLALNYLWSPVRSAVPDRLDGESEITARLKKTRYSHSLYTLTSTSSGARKSTLRHYNGSTNQEEAHS